MNPSTPAQHAAVTARGNVLVAAGAGTGKTSTLVRRCLALIDEGCSLENILMVTFTDAAAAEMRRRIQQSLQERLAPDAADPVGAEREHEEKQLALLSSAPISTLHSFCLRLIREHFFELEIDPDLTVLDERQTQPLIGQTLDGLFDRLYTGETEMARSVRSMIRGRGRGTDDRIRALVLRLHRYTQSRPSPEQWLEAQIARFRQSRPDHWEEWLLRGFQDRRVLWRTAFEEHRSIPAAAAGLLALRELPASPSWLEAARAVQAITAAQADDELWPRGSKKAARVPLKSVFEEAEFLSSLTPRPDLDPLAEDWELVRHEMEALLQLAQEFAREFRRAKRDLGAVDFADLEQLALQVLVDPSEGRPSLAARKWQEQFHYVFVDEYQDINAAQDAILTALSRSGSAANRFLVGDVKQSIYRFRLAEPAIFQEYERAWSRGTETGQRVVLSDNFRSREAILEFINSVFGRLMREELGGVRYEPLNFGRADLRQALARVEGAPPVELHLIVRSDDSEDDSDEELASDDAGDADLPVTEREARLVALQLRGLHERRHPIWDKETKEFRPGEWRDMVGLLRSPGGRAEAYAKEFHAAGVPLDATRSGFFESTEIADLLSLLKVIDNHRQDIPLLALLRSPIVGLSLDELAEVGSTNRERNFWLTLQRYRRDVQPRSAISDLEPGAGGKIDRFLGQMTQWRELMRQTSLSHCLETALLETQYEELVLAEPRGEAGAANIRRFLTLARQYDPYQRQGLFRFLRFVEVQEEMAVDFEPAALPAENAVRLLSIHRSKGLEFPVVALAGLGGQFNFQDLREDILLDAEYGLCPKIAAVGGEQHYPSLPHWLASRRQRRELLAEEMRLLYVAVSRACDHLILTGTDRSKRDPQWPSVTAEPSPLEWLSVRDYLGWIRQWLSRATATTDWTDSQNGATRLLRWRIWTENELSRMRPAPAPVSAASAWIHSWDDAALRAIRARVSWQYPGRAATVERAKTTVTELRRRPPDEDATASEFLPQSRGFDWRIRPASTSPVRRLSAAEIGIAHHTFLQRLDLERAETELDLRNEAERLRHASVLSAEEGASLDFAAVARFWQSEVGRKIRDQAASVHREMPFTARFSPRDLAEAGLPVQPSLPADEFVVVQGMVDLAVILATEIWIVDFKTDSIGDDEWLGKVRGYQDQIRLYSLALARIYRRPVTQAWLEFLVLGRTVACPPRS